MRRYERPGLEHDFVAVMQRESGGVAAHAQAISKQGDSSVEAQQSSPPERHAPDREEIAEASRAVEVNDARRRIGPLVRMARRTADTDARGNDDGEAVREQLEVNALRRMSLGGGAVRVHRGTRLVQRAWADRRRYRHVIEAIALVGLLAGCGGGAGAGAPTITVGAARTYHVTGFGPTSGIQAGKPTLLSFTIVQPNGAPLTRYKHGSGPHNGVDLVIVRNDDSHVLYEDSDIHAHGHITQPVVFPAPGRYRIVIDVYPQQAGPTSPFNFQLFEWVTVAGSPDLRPMPAYSPTTTVDGYRFTLVREPKLRAIQPAFLTFDVASTSGKPATFSLWRGALAHAIFIRKGSLDYFHTHVCPPGATNCGTRLGGASVTGVTSTPGKLKVGVLVPAPGTWRLFLLTYIDGRERVAPFTLAVK